MQVPNEAADADRLMAKGEALALQPDRLLTEAEVTDLGIGARFLQNARIRGDGPPYLKIGRAVRYKVSDLRAWLDARRVTSTSEDLK